MTGRRVAAAVTALFATAAALGGCAASSRAPSGRSGEPVSSPAASSVTPASSAPPSTPSTGPGTTTAGTTSPASRPPSSPSGSPDSSPTSSPPHAPTPPPSTCGRLTIRVLLGSGAPGYEFAALQFVNDGRRACTLVGVPAVTLARGGRAIGTPSDPSDAHAPFTSYRLAPGATAESKLKDFSNCNAPLSQTITVRAPGSTLTSTRPGELRACRLVVYPLGAPE